MVPVLSIRKPLLQIKSSWSEIIKQHVCHHELMSDWIVSHLGKSETKTSASRIIYVHNFSRYGYTDRIYFDSVNLRFKYTGNFSLPNFLRLAICFVKLFSFNCDFLLISIGENWFTVIVSRDNAKKDWSACKMWLRNFARRNAALNAESIYECVFQANRHILIPNVSMLQVIMMKEWHIPFRVFQSV